jgi:hypothetical protein
MEIKVYAYVQLNNATGAALLNNEGKVGYLVFSRASCFTLKLA